MNISKYYYKRKEIIIQIFEINMNNYLLNIQKQIKNVISFMKNVNINKKMSKNKLIYKL